VALALFPKLLLAYSIFAALEKKGGGFFF